MDKSFNDEELSDIMKEIEALEDGFNNEQEDFQASDVLEELSDLKESEAIPLRPQPRATHSEKQSSSHTAMSFKVQGDLNLELQFDVGGKIVSMTVSEHGLSIVMDGGMTFTVPMKDKKAA